MNALSHRRLCLCVITALGAFSFNPSAALAQSLATTGPALAGNPYTLSNGRTITFAGTPGTPLPGVQVLATPINCPPTCPPGVPAGSVAPFISGSQVLFQFAGSGSLAVPTSFFTSMSLATPTALANMPTTGQGQAALRPITSSDAGKPGMFTEEQFMETLAFGMGGHVVALAIQVHNAENEADRLSSDPDRNPWAFRRIHPEQTTPAQGQEQRERDKPAVGEVTSEGSGLDIPTISVPNAIQQSDASAASRTF